MSSRLAPHVSRLAIAMAQQGTPDRWREVEGSLLFADISGFTTLSEKLARRGPVGAEELVRILNSCFGGLLEQVRQEAGDTLKFGGDALLVLFTGSEHPLRASRAAWRMRRSLRQFVQHPPFEGFPRLGISMGLHSGNFQVFLVGRALLQPLAEKGRVGGHRELVIAGPAATMTVACEAFAEAGEILVSDYSASLLPPASRGMAKGPGVLLAGAAPPESGSRLPVSSLQEGSPDVDDLVPTGLRRQLLAAVEEPEHRKASVAFIRFSGVDQMVASSGGELVGEPLEQLIVMVQQAAEREGVTFLQTDIDRDGGKILLVAGAPTGSERDEEKLLRAARSIADTGSPLPLQIGINRGHVFTGVVGTEFRRTYSVFGDPVNLAARLLSKAAIGDVIATPAVLDRSATTFAVEPLEPFLVKGKRDPIVAFRVGEIVKARRIRSDPRLSLVGRDKEIIALRAAVEGARHGAGVVVEVVGEPGVGKSRLIDEVRETSGLPQLQVLCSPYETSTPYFAFRELLCRVANVEMSSDAAVMSERLVRRLEERAPQLIPWIPLLAIPMHLPVLPTRESEEIDPAFRRSRIQSVVTEFLAALLQDPTLVLFEDVHWMDEGSADFLGALASVAATQPWLVIATRRPEETGFRLAPGMRGVTMELRPLDAEASVRLLAEASEDQPLEEDEVQRLAERSGGNPLFLRGLLIVRSATAARDDLPDSVEAVIAARIDRLAAEDRAVLRYASVLGPKFEERLMMISLQTAADLTFDASTWGRLSEFIRLDQDGIYRFQHALFRDVAYSGLSYARRRELHKRVGDIYELTYSHRLQDYAELLSLHYSLSGVLEKTWRYSVMAGDRAREHYANAEAATLYRRAVEAGRQLAEVSTGTLAGILETLGDVSELAAHYDEALRAYEEARHRTRRGSVEVLTLLRKQGVLRERQGRYSDALRWYGRGLRAVAAAEDEKLQASHRIQLRLAYAGVLFRQGRFRKSVRWAELARDEAEKLGDRPAFGHACYLLHLTLTSLGAAERAQFRSQALPIFEELGDLVRLANTLNNLGIDAYYEGRWDDALGFYERDYATRERSGDVVGAATSLNNIGEIKSDQGYLEEAEALFTRAGTITRAARYRLLPVVTASNLGRAAARSGRFDQATSLLARALDGFEELRARSFMVETHARLAELASLAGQAASALKKADETLEMARQTGGSRSLESMLQRIRGWAFLQLGRYREAGDALAASERAGQDDHALYEVALTLQARAVLAQLTGSPDAAALQESGRILSTLGVVRIPSTPLPSVADAIDDLPSRV